MTDHERLLLAISEVHSGDREEAERIVAAVMREIAPLQAQIGQLQDKMTCMCGGEVNYSAWEGHTPVSIYDYALDQANEEIRQLKGKKL